MLANRPRRPVTDVQLADIAQMIETIGGYTSALASLIRSQQTNDVLWSGTVLLDANGRWEKSWQVPFATIAFWPSQAAGSVTITSDPAAAQPPTNGPGVWVFPAPGASEIKGRVFAGTGRQLTVYGTLNTVAGMLVVYSRPQPPS